MIAVQRTEHIDLQNMIETGQRNFRDTCKGPEKDYYPRAKTQRWRILKVPIASSQNLHQSIHIVAQINSNGSSKETRWKLWILANTEAIPQKLKAYENSNESSKNWWWDGATRRKEEPIDLWCLTWEIAKPNPHNEEPTSEPAKYFQRIPETR